MRGPDDVHADAGLVRPLTAISLKVELLHRPIRIVGLLIERDLVPMRLIKSHISRNVLRRRCFVQRRRLLGRFDGGRLLRDRGRRVGDGRRDGPGLAGSLPAARGRKAEGLDGSIRLQGMLIDFDRVSLPFPVGDKCGSVLFPRRFPSDGSFLSAVAASAAPVWVTETDELETEEVDVELVWLWLTVQPLKTSIKETLATEAATGFPRVMDVFPFLFFSGR